MKGERGKPLLDTRKSSWSTTTTQAAPGSLGKLASDSAGAGFPRILGRKERKKRIGKELGKNWKSGTHNNREIENPIEKWK